MIDGFGNGGAGDTDGSRLQSTGGSVGGWSTDTKPEDRQKTWHRRQGSVPICNPSDSEFDFKARLSKKEPGFFTVRSNPQ